MTVEVEVESDTSVRVSWDSLGPDITGYIVYYSQTGNSEGVTTEQSLSVPNTADSEDKVSVLIGDLVHNVEYQFQVVATAELEGKVVMGQRSMAVVIVVALPVITLPGDQGNYILHGLVSC